MENKYGLDARYFKEKLGLIVRDADNYAPEEMFRELQKYMMVAANQAKLKVTVKVRFPK